MLNYKKFIKENLFFFYNFYHAYKGFNKIVPRQAITNFNNSSKNLINKNDKKFSINGKVVEEISENINISINSVMGWVPFIEKKTSVVIYNFFSINYAIRGQFYVQISLSHNNKIIEQKKFWIPSDICHEFNLKKIFPHINADAVYVEMFHPKLNKNHGGHDGHLRFWGKYYSNEGNYLSTVHSSAHSKEIYFDKRANMSRNYVYKSKLVKSQTIKSKTNSIVLFDTFKSNKTREGKLPGFNILNNKNNDPCAVWHHGGSKKNINKKTKPEKIIQSFWCPPNNNLDPTIVLDNLAGNIFCEKGLIVNIVKKSKIINSKFLKIDNFFSSKISEIFNEQIQTPYSVLCEYWFIEDSDYMHIHYDSVTSPGDQTHSHECNWNIKENKIFVNNLKGNQRARKFFHIHKNINNCVNYLTIPTHMTQNEQPAIKLRIITDKKYEYVKNIKLETNNPIHIINIENEFPEYSDNTSDCAVIQLESGEDNFNCDLIHLNNDIDAVAVDHLTGG